MTTGLTKRALAELLGTFAFVFGAAGAVMADELSGGAVGPVGMALAAGLVVAAMVYSLGHHSGAHINPAVTLGFALTKHLSWKDAMAYWLAQGVGAIGAAVALRGVMGDVAGMGRHTPSGGVVEAAAMEFVLTLLLMLVIMAVATDRRAAPAAAGVAIGAMVAVAILVGGPISGGSMNPARSLAPALVTWSWSGQWVYLVAPVAGAGAGALGYSWLARVANAGPDKSVPGSP